MAARDLLKRHTPVNPELIAALADDGYMLAKHLEAAHVSVLWKRQQEPIPHLRLSAAADELTALLSEAEAKDMLYLCFADRLAERDQVQRRMNAVLGFQFLDERKNLVFIGPPGVGQNAFGHRDGSQCSGSWLPGAVS